MIVDSQFNRTLIYIVDDDEDDLFFIKSAIANNIPNSVIKCFINGKQLIDHFGKLKSAMPAFVLLDLNMPVLNGKETLKQIRQNELITNLPVVIFSTSNCPVEKSLCFEYGANNYYCKPSCVDAYNEIAQKLKVEYVERAVVN